MKKLWGGLGLCFLLLATGFMNEVDYFGMDFALGFLATLVSLLASIICTWKAGGFENDRY